MVIFTNNSWCTTFLVSILLNIAGSLWEDVEPVDVVNDEIPPETWDNEDYQNWEEKLKDDVNDDENRDSTWQIPQEEQDSVLYDLYNKQPDIILDVDEDNIELSDSWTVLDLEEDEDDSDGSRQKDYLNNEDDLKEDMVGEFDTPAVEPYNEEENLQCDENIIEKTNKKSKLTPKQRNKDEFYFKHKTYGKKKKKKGSADDKIQNWKRNCCIRGKRVGNGRRTFMAENIFQECKDRTRNLASRMSRSCKWIFWSCCEARALRRYYVYHHSSQKELFSNKVTSKRTRIDVYKPLTRRSNSDSTDEDATGSSSEIGLSFGFQSGIVDECCKKQCMLPTLLSYCANVQQAGNIDLNEILPPESESFPSLSEEDMAAYQSQQAPSNYAAESSKDITGQPVHLPNHLSYSSRPNLGHSARNKPVFIVLPQLQEDDDRALGEYRF